MLSLRMRRGVTLLITLSIIAAMFALVGILLKTIDSAREEAQHRGALIEADLLRKDLGELLKKHLGSTPSPELLSTLYSSVLPIADKEGDFSLTAQCRPLLDRIPISWLAHGDDSAYRRQYQLAKALFERMADEGELRDPELFFEVIADALRGLRASSSRTGWIGNRPGAMTLEGFRALQDRYRFSADDPRVYRVAWEKVFLLDIPCPEPKTLDKEFLAPELVARLYDLDPLLVKKEYTPGHLSEFLSQMAEGDRYGWLFGKKAPLALRCSAQYTFREEEYNIDFDYQGERIARFELHP